ncbi:MAG: glycosyltransferase family 9 protein [Cyclobacteriaceae bacterium]|nr:glycosyltransferase family 9 protein [Cyclobacteriaceae bacterium]
MKVAYSKLLEKFSFVLLLPLILVQRKKSLTIRSILLVEPFQMGDVLSLTPLIEPLMKKYPAAKISVLTKPGSGAVLEYDSRIHKVYFADFPWSDHGEKKITPSRLFGCIHYVISIRKIGFDLGIDTRGDVRSQILLVLAGCRLRVGYLNYLHSNINLSGHLLTHYLIRSKYLHRYEWNVELLTCLEIENTAFMPVNFPSFLPANERLLSLKEMNTIVIHIGGGWIYRRWDETKWIELINFIKQQKEADILVMAGNGEKDVLQRIKSGIEASEKIHFKVTSLQELISYINQCSLFIGLDSGPMNLAVCLNKSVLGLFGPGDSTMWRPLNSKGKFIQRTENFPCSPCLQINCKFPRKNCMNEIEVKDVVEKLFVS